MKFMNINLMVSIIEQIFGEEKNLNTLQMCSRAVVVFIIALVYIRIAGLKTFGKNSTFDNVLIFMMGAMLSRAVAGVSPFFPVVLSTFTMIIMSRIVSYLTINNKQVARLVKGKPECLYKDGKMNHSKLQAMMLSEDEVMENVRLQAHTNNLQDVEAIFIETSGEMSVVKKKQ